MVTINLNQIIDDDLQQLLRTAASTITSLMKIIENKLLQFSQKRVNINVNSHD